MGKEIFYEMIPFFYSACGIITIMFSKEAIARISGLLLISAAMIIFWFRLEYRKQRAKNAEDKLCRAQERLNKNRTSAHCDV